MTSRTELEDNVVAAIQEMVDIYTYAPEFLWTAVPSKSLRDGGLGLRFNAWYACCRELQGLLPDKRPYTRLVISPTFADRTFGKNLSSLRYWLIEQLLVIEARNV